MIDESTFQKISAQLGRIDMTEASLWGVSTSCDAAEVLACVLSLLGHDDKAAAVISLHALDDEDPEVVDGTGDRHAHIADEVAAMEYVRTVLLPSVGE